MIRAGKLEPRLLKQYSSSQDFNVNDSKLRTFPRKNMKKDKYLDYIPFTWIGCNNKGVFLRTDLLWDMMMISMLNYQVDEFVETVTGKEFSGDLTTIEHLIRSLFNSEDTASSSNGDTSTSSNGSMNGHDAREKAAQTEKCDGEGSDSSLQSIKHTLTNVSKYLAEELCAHLATMCRMSNDYGSLARDEAEKNLNSINFPEFNMAEDLVHAEKGEKLSDLERRKMELLELIGYERSCLMAAKEKLFPLLSACIRDVMNVFIDVTDLYGQIYVARDIASRM
ncbi:hypothetical protein HYFRA_00012770 [Hymenoscyphus fraxineus]|uniref:Uncharacterized protein n=1 Tax=Hymenoscyphus fraxineus TaxID=746836 RepID=A0A9N9L4N1_9HELO|nr:hypothetical protein HYFRA_00012770 [Hymenoscyphus fraxineus]